MPELLLSSLSGKDFSLTSKIQSTGASSLDIEGGEEGKFTYILSSAIGESNIENSNLEGETEGYQFLNSIEELTQKIDSIDLDIEELSELKQFLNRNDFTSEGLSEEQLGSKLPELLKELQAKVDALNKAIEERQDLTVDQPSVMEQTADDVHSPELVVDTTQIEDTGSDIQASNSDSLDRQYGEEPSLTSESEVEEMLVSSKEIENEVNVAADASDDEQLKSLETILMQFNQDIRVIKNEAENNQKVGTLASQSFAYNSRSGAVNVGNWQQYGPQQLVQNSQFSGANGSNPAAVVPPEPLTPMTDQSFHQQMEQLASDKFVDVNDKADVLADALVDAKDKTLNKFSDLQLKSVGDGLKQYSMTLNTPVNSQNWSDELSQKIVWFSGRNISEAEMHLNPAELGPIDVKINVQNDVASISFNVNTASVKDLLESSVVRLREMMEANGVNVGEVNVDSGSTSRDQSGHHSSGAGHTGVNGSDDAQNEIDGQVTEQTITIEEKNLVDYFV